MKAKEKQKQYIEDLLKQKDVDSETHQNILRQIFDDNLTISEASEIIKHLKELYGK